MVSHIKFQIAFLPFLMYFFISSGTRQQNAFNEIQKFELNKSEQSIPSSKSLPIPVQQQRRQLAAGGKLQPDIIESPYSSPGQSPKLSPHCSPAQSPVSRRKEAHDIYSSTANWLKSIRLHKYSDLLQNFPFEKVTYYERLENF